MNVSNNSPTFAGRILQDLNNNNPPEGSSRESITDDEDFSWIEDYQILKRVGQGAFANVYKARDIETGTIVAIKITKERGAEELIQTRFREWEMLRVVCHENTIKPFHINDDDDDSKHDPSSIYHIRIASYPLYGYVTIPYMDYTLSAILRNPNVKLEGPQIKCYMRQLLSGVAYLHEMFIIHRDLKPGNILINNEGLLVIADFGLARFYNEDGPQPRKGNGPGKQCKTEKVGTIQYMAPELLLGLREYTPAVDMWSVGCIFGEMVQNKGAVFPGENEGRQTEVMFELLGKPTERNMPGWDSLPHAYLVSPRSSKRSGLAGKFRQLGTGVLPLLRSLLLLDWHKRINAMDALEHLYFKKPPLPARPEDLAPMEPYEENDSDGPGAGSNI